MWTNLALLAVISATAGQAKELTLSNIRDTYGVLGADRPDNKVLPGDRYSVAFDINGIKCDDEGKVRYRMAMEVADSAGKIIYGQEPRDLEGYITLGGSRLPAFTHVDTALSQPPGEYTVKVTITDLSTSAAAKLVRKFEVLPKRFGLIGLTTSYDGEGRAPAPFGGVVGQLLYVSFFAVGWERSTTKHAHVSVEMRILDESGRPTVAKAFPGEVNSPVADKVAVIPMQFELRLNRPGKFTVELSATDRIGSKAAKLSIPIRVLEQMTTGSYEQK